MQKSIHTADYKELRELLRATRTEAGLSQRDVAAVLKVPHSYVAKVEMGERRIDLVEFCHFLTACGADPVPALTRLATAFTRSAPGPRRRGGRKP
ncbi:MAG: helix-turn-helix transcriptional regulator [Planctomycetota bacterium]|nr:helix-turn-helix transcriptional regulator [Planctomycetota bacterium]